MGGVSIGHEMQFLWKLERRIVLMGFHFFFFFFFCYVEVYDG